MLPTFVGLVIRRPVVGDNLDVEQLDCLFLGCLKGSWVETQQLILGWVRPLLPL